MDSVVLLNVGLGAAGSIASAVVALLMWSMRRNLMTMDARDQRIETSLDRVATDVRQLSSTVGSHGERLAAGNERFAALDREISEVRKTVTGIMRDGCPRAPHTRRSDREEGQ